MRRLLFTGATVVMGLAGSLGVSASSATHAAAAVNSPARSCGWYDYRYCREDRRCDDGFYDCDRHGHHDRDRDRCDYRWGYDCRYRWW
jgi:hypothetical protein